MKTKTSETNAPPGSHLYNKSNRIIRLLNEQTLDDLNEERVDVLGIEVVLKLSLDVSWGV